MSTITKEQARQESIARYEAKVASGEVAPKVYAYQKSAKHVAFDKREADRAASIARYEAKLAAGQVLPRAAYVKSEKSVAYAAQVAKVAAVKAHYAANAKAKAARLAKA